jgi:hypothetical protein
MLDSACNNPTVCGLDNKTDTTQAAHWQRFKKN